MIRKCQCMINQLYKLDSAAKNGKKKIAFLMINNAKHANDTSFTARHHIWQVFLFISGHFLLHILK